MSALIDTNILIYAWDTSDRAKQNNAIAAIQNYGHHGYLSVQNISEFSSFMIRNGCDLQLLQETISDYSKLMTILPVTSLDITTAIRGVQQYKMSFWDAQIWAVALHNNIPIIISEDGPSNQTIEGVTYWNPL